MRNTFFLGRIFLILGCTLLFGCAGPKTAAESEQFFAMPGRYSAAPLNAVRPRVGVPAPAVEVVEGAAPDVRAGDDAADQLFWVADQSGRFNLIERERLAEIIDRQGLTGIIRPGELARPGQLQGVDYLLVCRISGLSIRGGERPATVSVANVERMLHVSGPQVPRITTVCQVGMLLIDPATGASVAIAQDSFRRVCSPEAMGLTFAKPEAAWGTLHLDDFQLNQVLRVVLDDAMRQLLPVADTLLTRPTSPVIAGAASSTTDPAQGSAAPKTQPVIAKLHCPECGAACTADDQFCPNCGARLALKGVGVKPGGK